MGLAGSNIDVEGARAVADALKQHKVRQSLPFRVFTYWAFHLDTGPD